MRSNAPNEQIEAINKKENLVVFPTGFAKHHTFSIDKIKPLHTAKKSFLLNLLEYVEISAE